MVTYGYLYLLILIYRHLWFMEVLNLQSFQANRHIPRFYKISFKN